MLDPKHVDPVDPDQLWSMLVHTALSLAVQLIMTTILHKGFVENKIKKTLSDFGPKIYFIIMFWK